MKPINLFLLCLLYIGFTGCKDDKKNEDIPMETGISTYYFIRHAEKDRTDSENVDPELSQEGLGRAMHWAVILKDVKFDAIYSTDFRRTSMTAAPTSIKQNIDVEYYDPKNIDIDQFKRDNLNKTVLVVGHSNTTPEFVNNIIGMDTYTEIDDNDNGSLFLVQVVNGTATSQKLHFDCNCPKRK
tara:strand:+ start:5018 stop:5569 length:552 start_codon:yes stop_codon:yes gene_type:complete